MPLKHVMERDVFLQVKAVGTCGRFAAPRTSCDGRGGF